MAPRPARLRSQRSRSQRYHTFCEQQCRCLLLSSKNEHSYHKCGCMRCRGDNNAGLWTLWVSLLSASVWQRPAHVTLPPYYAEADMLFLVAIYSLFVVVGCGFLGYHQNHLQNLRLCTITARHDNTTPTLGAAQPAATARDFHDAA